MWFSTYDGLNSYDGRTIDVFRTDFSKGRTLDNNIISRIQIALDDKLWLQSYSGETYFLQILYLLSIIMYFQMKKLLYFLIGKVTAGLLESGICIIIIHIIVAL